MATLLDTLVTKISFMIEGTPLETLVRILDNDTVATQELGTASVETAEKMKVTGAAANTLGVESEKATIKLKETGHAAREAGVAADFFGEQIKSLKTIVSGFFGAFLGIEAITKSIEAFNELDGAMAQIQAGLKSTGDASGYTSDQLEEMAEKLQQTSRYDKAAILQNVTAQLLSFKNISGDVFQRAQQDIIDYSARSNRPLNEVSIQIGRALNNPAQALGVLSRVGIQFNKEQAKMIDGMVKSGDAAGAQAYMLQYLESSFKGSAQAAADAGAGPLIQFGNNLLDLASTIGGLIEDVLNPFLNTLNKLAVWMQNNSTFVKIFAAAIGILALAIYGVRAATAAWAVAQGVLDALLSPFLVPILAITAAAAVLALVIQDLWVYFHGGDSVIGRLINQFDSFIAKHQDLKAIVEVLGAVFKLVWAAIKLDFEVTVKVIEEGINYVMQLFAEASNIIDKYADKITGAFGKIENYFGISSSSASGGGSGSSDGFAGMLNNLTGKINGATAVIGGNMPQSNSITNNSHAPVTNVNLTVHANGSDGDHIGKAVVHHLKQHYKNATRAYDSGVAS